MATVKGDVHDIGKNIVGVVLAVQQLRGHRPRRHGAVRRARGREDPRRRRSTKWHVAKEMQRLGYRQPLRGATT
jgi:hypothetical protein